MADCEHDDMMCDELEKAGYGDDVLLGCLCCQHDEIMRLRAAMHEISPYKDVIVCYASTCSEHEGNLVSKAFDVALDTPHDEQM